VIEVPNWTPPDQVLAGSLGLPSDQKGYLVSIVVPVHQTFLVAEWQIEGANLHGLEWISDEYGVRPYNAAVLILALRVLLEHPDDISAAESAAAHENVWELLQ
jgi:hypothetical protein